MEINQDFAQRQQTRQHHAPRIECLRVIIAPPLLRNQRHHVPDVFVRTDHERLHHRFFQFPDIRRLRQKRWVINLLHRPVGQRHPIDHARISSDDIHAVLAAQPFLHNLQVQQAEEAAAKAKPEGHTRLCLIREGRIVELEFAHVCLEMFVIRRVDRVNPAEHHRMNLLEARQHARRIPRICHGVAHLHFLRAFDVSGEITRLTDLQLVADIGLGIETSDFLHFDRFARMQQLHLHPRLQLTVENPDMRDHALVSVEERIKPQRLQADRARRLGRGNPLHNRFENLLDADPLFRTRRNCQLGGDRQNILQLLLRQRHIRVRQVDLVDHGNDQEILLHRQMHVGDRLRLDALGRVNDEQRPLARAQTA